MQSRDQQLRLEQRDIMLESFLTSLHSSGSATSPLLETGTAFTPAGFDTYTVSKVCWEFDELEVCVY